MQNDISQDDCAAAPARPASRWGRAVRAGVLVALLCGIAAEIGALGLLGLVHVQRSQGSVAEAGLLPEIGRALRIARERASHLGASVGPSGQWSGRGRAAFAYIDARASGLADAVWRVRGVAEQVRTVCTAVCR